MSAWPWPSSDSTGKVIPAFVEALQGVEDVARNKSASIETKSGSRMNYGYADLDAVLDASKPVLTKHGLAVTQAATVEGVHAVVMHETGEWLSFPPLQVSTQQNTPQGQGSALTYARRYQMLALLGIATEDDDGTAAAKKPKAAPRTAAPVNGSEDPNPAQTKKAMALFTKIGVRDRDERNALTSAYIGREVSSWKEVSPAERNVVIDKLEKVPPA
jgi:ERF superfamily